MELTCEQKMISEVLEEIDIYFPDYYPVRIIDNDFDFQDFQSVLHAFFVITLNREKNQQILQQKEAGLPESQWDYFVPWDRTPFLKTVHHIVKTYKSKEEADSLMQAVNTLYPTTPETDDMDNEEFADVELLINRTMQTLFDQASQQKF